MPGGGSAGKCPAPCAPLLLLPILSPGLCTWPLPPAFLPPALSFLFLLCSWLERNNLTGGVPASWAALTSLRRLVLRPGNPELCGPVPPGLPFSICTDADVSCIRQKTDLMEDRCQAGVPPAAPAPAPAGGGAGPASAPPSATAPGTPPTTGSSAGGGGVSAAAIAAPVAVGVAMLAAVLAGLYVAGRRRKRQGEAAPQQAPLVLVGVSGMHTCSIRPAPAPFCTTYAGSS